MPTIVEIALGVYIAQLGMALTYIGMDYLHRLSGCGCKDHDHE